MSGTSKTSLKLPSSPSMKGRQVTKGRERERERVREKVEKDCFPILNIAWIYIYIDKKVKKSVEEGGKT